MTAVRRTLVGVPVPETTSCSPAPLAANAQTTASSLHAAKETSLRSVRLCDALFIQIAIQIPLDLDLIIHAPLYNYSVHVRVHCKTVMLRKCTDSLGSKLIQDCVCRYFVWQVIDTVVNVVTIV